MVSSASVRCQCRVWAILSWDTRPRTWCPESRHLPGLTHFSPFNQYDIYTNCPPPSWTRWLSSYHRHVLFQTVSRSQILTQRDTDCCPAAITSSPVTRVTWILSLIRNRDEWQYQKVKGERWRCETLSEDLRYADPNFDDKCDVKSHWKQYWPS